MQDTVDCGLNRVSDPNEITVNQVSFVLWYLICSSANVGIFVNLHGKYAHGLKESQPSISVLLSPTARGESEQETLQNFGKHCISITKHRVLAKNNRKRL